MNVKILGCSGGVGSTELQTTSILVGETTLIDAGTGVASLTLEQLTKINRLFLTHSHMDHIAVAPMIVDSTSDARSEALQIHALPETIATLKKHIFNWEIWPDFAEIQINNLVLQSYHHLKVGDVFELPQGRLIVAPADHQVAACSYLLIGPRQKLFFSGDTIGSPEVIEFLHAHAPIDHIILECAFSRAEKKIAEASKHMYSDSVVELIHALDPTSQFYITHLKPNHRDVIMEEILACKTRRISRLFSYQVFQL